MPTKVQKWGNSLQGIQGLGTASINKGSEMVKASLMYIKRYENDHHEGFLQWEKSLKLSQDEMKEIVEKINGE